MAAPAFLVFGFLSRFAGAQILSVPEACTGMTCLNAGVVEAGDEFGCRCNCTENFTGLMCETELRSSEWPNGPYATPMSIYGCPEDPGQGWRTGFLNMTFLLTSSMDYANPLINDSGRRELLGPVSNQVMQLNFCYKLHDKQLPVEDDVKWPPGNYAIYRAGGSCPNEFQPDRLVSDIPPLLRQEIDGFIPDVEIEDALADEDVFSNGHSPKMSKIKIDVCHRLETSDTTWHSVARPFILLEGNLREESERAPCPDIPPLEVLEETSPIGWRYCSYRRDRTRDRDALRRMVPRPGQDPTRIPYLAMKTSLRSEGVDKLMSDIQGYGVPDNGPDNSFKGTNDDLWLLFDLGQTIQLDSIIIHIGNAAESYTWTYGNSPVVDVSDYRWAFLSRGSLRCSSNMEVNTSGYFLQRCHHSVRYAAILTPNFLQYQNETTAFYKSFSRADVRGKGFGYGRDLGMRDGGIQDFQITAPTDLPRGFGRPHGSGLCAKLEGTDPYLQVDLLVATKVEGLTIFNLEARVATPASNVYKPESILVGTTELRLQYGFDVNKLHNYTYLHGNAKIFHLDLSLPYSHPQTFRLQRPVFATIIRVYPHATNELSLHLELIGGRKQRLTTLQCRNKPYWWWQKQRSIFVSPLSYQVPYVTRLSLNRSDLQCWTQCEARFEEACTGVLYNNTHCLSYSISDTAIYRSLSSPHMLAHQMMCLDDPSDTGSVMVSHSKNGEVILTVPSSTINQPGTVITSRGYPVYYDSGYIYKWTIDFLGKGFIEVLFTHIFLNTYETDTNGGSLVPCTDSIILTPKPWRIDPRRLRSYDRVLFEENVISVLNSAMNGEQVTYSTDREVLELLFQACAQDSDVVLPGKGFRAIFTKLDVPQCQAFSKGPSEPCLNDRDNSIATLSSKSFSASGNHHVRDEVWYIDAFDRYVIMTFNFFDMTCKGNSLVQIASALTDTQFNQYCNLQRPVGDIVTGKESMVVRVSMNPYREGTQLDGFRASVKAVKLNKYIGDMDIQLDPCVTLFEKCYRFYGPRPDNELHAIPWTAINCSALFGPSAQLVTVRNKAENDFLIYAFQKEMIYKKTKPGSKGPKGQNSIFDSYVGLERGEDIRNTLREQWVDGSPVTYTAWASHQPDDRQRKKCTKMAINSLYETNTWQTTDCNTPQASFFVCEVRTRTIPQENLYSQLATGNEKEVEFGHFLCKSGEVISVVYLCDDIKDCLDGSDEFDCLQIDDKEGCPSGYFTCASGDCVVLSKCCDFLPDCPDASDEYCDFPACSGFKCANQQCIPSTSVCDFKSDCYDGSDEADCDSCQADTMFRCNDGKCIPRRLQCDGVADCSNSEDEDERCEPSNRLSCIEWWQAGFRHSGVYAIDTEDQLECSFDDVKTTEIVETKYHNLGFAGSGGGRRVQYKDLKSVKELVNEEQTCHQSVVQTCHPPRDRIAEIDHEERELDSWPCHCLRFIKSHQSNVIKPCSDVTRNETAERGEGWLASLSRISSLEGMPITELLMKPNASLADIRLKLEPVVCQQKFGNRTDDLPCERGHPVDAATKCLFEYDEYNLLTGCRDLTHLQDCEDFDCPSGYVKCLGSFCLSTALLCDGVRQCPNGQDELNCWCGRNTKPARFLVLYYDEIDLEEAAMNIASQLYQQGSDLPVIDLVKYKAVDNRYLNTVLGQTGFKVILRHTEYQSVKIKQEFRTPYSEQISLDKMIPGLVQGNILQLIETEQTLSTVLVVLHNKQYPTVLRNLMTFNHSIMEAADLFVLAVGESDTQDWSTLPVYSKYQSFKDWSFAKPSLAKIFSNICPEPEFPVCPGLFRCHASRICLPMSSLCDNRTQCPHGDDEKHCDLLCPANCSCSEYSLDCSTGRFSQDVLGVMPMVTRSLDLSSNTITITEAFDVVYLPYLMHLIMSSCKLAGVPRRFLSSMTNLLYLDLSFNAITELTRWDFANKSRLQYLDISGNNDLLTLSSLAFSELINLKSFAITGTKIHSLPGHTFSGLRLTSLDLSDNEIDVIDEHAFDKLYVNVLNLEDNPISYFSSNMFREITSMSVLRTSAYRFCCLDHLRDVDCFPRRDEFSSCEDLMRNDALRFLLWIIGVCALVGNALSLLYRLKFDRKRLKLGYGIFVTNLAVSDFLMGVYLLIIAVADSSFRGQYILHDDWWRQSGWCSFAGIISTVSSEASIMFMCLITIDRIIVIKYPFGAIRFKTKSALALSVIVWLFVLVLATVPLWFTSYFKKLFYSRSGVCLALPLTRDRPPGWAYSITLFVGFNFLTFLLIASGQWMIYREMHASSRKTGRNTSRKQDLAVARNLLLVVSTDFLCWFPIGVMGIMAFCGYVIPSEVYAWSAVLILPINSALNPFLYTFSAIIGSKSFKPSVEEQARPTVFSKDEVTKICDMWNSNLFLPRKNARLTRVPLTDYIRDQGLSVTSALLIAMKLTNAIRHLHSVQLLHGQLGFCDVYVVEKNDIIQVTIKTAPKCVLRQAEKKKDIEQLGNITRQLMINIGPRSDCRQI